MIIESMKGNARGGRCLRNADQGAFQTFGKERKKSIHCSDELQSDRTRQDTHGFTVVKTFEESSLGDIYRTFLLTKR